MNNTSTLYFILSDHLNSSTILVDSNGTLSEQSDYSPYGLVVYNNKTTDLDNQYKFTSNQGGFINKASGFVSNSIGNVFENVANVYDPDQKSTTRVVALGLVALDVGTSGKGKVTEQGLKSLPRAVSASEKLDNLSKIFSKSVDDILDYVSEKGVKYIDNAHNGNVNILAINPSNGKDLIRVTLEPTLQKVISAGHVRLESFINYIQNGRFIRSN